jgi:hypothetical protein
LIVYLGVPALALAASFLLWRLWRGRGKGAVFGLALLLAVIFYGGLAITSITGAACLGDRYAEPESKRVGGAAIYLAGFLLLVVGVVAVIAMGALTIAEWVRERKDRPGA